jgi:dolichol-phosphate mannosyltransferase
MDKITLPMVSAVSSFPTLDYNFEWGTPALNEPIFMEPAPTSTLDLLVVMPVYNEQVTVANVAEEWCQQLDACGMRYKLVAINDGSKDQTPQVLEKLQQIFGDRLEVVNQKNVGHGQSALNGYRLAIERGIPWVFQIDSDGQCDPRYFAECWKLRNDYDVVSGYRARRDDGLRRVIVSTVLRWFILLAFRTNCPDANVPYRLMRTAAIAPLVKKIQPDFSLANVGLAVLVARAGLKCRFVAISFRARQGGEPTVPYAKFGDKAKELYQNLRDLLKNT